MAGQRDELSQGDTWFQSIGLFLVMQGPMISLHDKTIKHITPDTVFSSLGYTSTYKH